MGAAANHCAKVGDVLARMHLAARDYPGTLQNPRGPSWWHETAPRVMPFLDEERKALLGNELAFQDAHRFTDLPRGPIHADLFRDNVLFDGGRLVALLDCEQASSRTWVYDLAVCLNAWCFSGPLQPALVAALVEGYRTVRELEPTEYPLLYVEARAAAMRFTITRITDVYLAGAAMPGKDFREFLRRLEAWRAMEAADLVRLVGRDTTA